MNSIRSFNLWRVFVLFALSGVTSAWSQDVLDAESPSDKSLNASQYQTLLGALETTKLQDVLEQSGPFTVFAPSDAAFRQIDQSDFKTLLRPENSQQLKSILTYHIVAGKLTASSILRALSRGKGYTHFTTVQGEELLATLEGSDIILTDCSGNRARIVDADLDQNNLVFHQIDKVILPRPL